MQRWRSPPPSQNQNRSTCAQACVTCTVNPYKTKSGFKSTRLTGKSTNQRRSHYSNTLRYWYFDQSENVRGRGHTTADPVCLLPSIFPVLQPEDERLVRAGQKAVFKVCFKKRHESRPLLICCPAVLLSSYFIWADWHVVLAPVVAYISVYLYHFSIKMSTVLKLKEN